MLSVALSGIEVGYCGETGYSDTIISGIDVISTGRKQIVESIDKILGDIEQATTKREKKGLFKKKIRETSLSSEDYSKLCKFINDYVLSKLYSDYRALGGVLEEVLSFQRTMVEYL